MEENLQGTFEIEDAQQNKLGRNTENLKGKEIYWQVCTLCLAGHIPLVYTPSTAFWLHPSSLKYFGRCQQVPVMLI